MDFNPERYVDPERQAWMRKRNNQKCGSDYPLRSPPPSGSGGRSKLDLENSHDETIRPRSSKASGDEYDIYHGEGEHGGPAHSLGGPPPGLSRIPESKGERESLVPLSGEATGGRGAPRIVESAVPQHERHGSTSRRPEPPRGSHVRFEESPRGSGRHESRAAAAPSSSHHGRIHVMPVPLSGDSRQPPHGPPTRGSRLEPRIVESVVPLHYDREEQLPRYSRQEERPPQYSRREERPPQYSRQEERPPQYSRREEQPRFSGGGRMPHEGSLRSRHEPRIVESAVPDFEREDGGRGRQRGYSRGDGGVGSSRR